MTRVHRSLACITVGALLPVIVSAQGPCIVEAGGCRDLTTGKLYVDRAGRLVDPETGAPYGDGSPAEPAVGGRDAGRGAGTATAPLPADVVGGYTTSSAEGRLFHAMDVRAEANGLVRVNLMMGLTVPRFDGCEGGGVVGSGRLTADRVVSFSVSRHSATAAHAPACRIEVRFDPQWGAADVKEAGCQAVHGPACSFAGRYLRVRR